MALYLAAHLMAASPNCIFAHFSFFSMKYRNVSAKKAKNGLKSSYES